MYLLAIRSSWSAATILGGRSSRLWLRTMEYVGICLHSPHPCQQVNKLKGCSVTWTKMGGFRKAWLALVEACDTATVIACIVALSDLFSGTCKIPLDLHITYVLDHSLGGPTPVSSPAGTRKRLEEAEGPAKFWDDEKTHHARCSRVHGLVTQI